MSAPANPTDVSCDVRFGQVGLACIRVHDSHAARIFDDLEQRVRTAPQMFLNTATIVDLSYLSELPDDGAVDALLEAVRAAGMRPVAFAYADSRIDDLAQRMGLPVIAKFREAMQRQQAASPAQPDVPPAANKLPPVSPATVGAMQHHHPVRSGQQVYARGQDLIIVGNVANGAEIIADGSIHIYGTLRGRALAGAQGDDDARIFCTDFKPELVSINGCYRVFESVPEDLANRTVQCYLEAEKLITQTI